MHIHLIGIAGVGMSGIAELALEKGHRVSGSDLVRTDIVDRLEKKGASFFLGHSPDHVTGADTVVYTAAVKSLNPELVKAREMGLRVFSRAEMLGRLMRGYRHSVAVAGSHGKTTTTAMVTSILEYAGYDPTALVGGEMGKNRRNVLVGCADYFVTEACEYQSSFLHLEPDVGIILNVELDHVDCYADLSSIVQAFEGFTGRIKPGGCLVANGDDPELTRMAQGISGNIITYGAHPSNAWRYSEVDFDGPIPIFRVWHGEKDLGRWRLSVPGHHNIYNALAASAASAFLGVDPGTIQAALETFVGALRRFELKGEVCGITIVDDYAHHPTEVRATLEAAKLYTEGSLWCVFQPHTFSRTKALLEDFADALGIADRVVLTDIYAAREVDNGEVSSKDLANLVKTNGKEVICEGSFDRIARRLLQEASPGDLVITMGAGDIFKLGNLLVDYSDRSSLSTSAS